MDRLDVGNAEVPRVKIETEEGAVKWVEELVSEMLDWRERCNVIIPGNSQATVTMQRRALWTFLEKHGQVVGALKSLLLVGMISPRCYTELTQRALNTLAPTVIGSV
jgi:hypothetical protein